MSRLNNAPEATGGGGFRPADHVDELQLGALGILKLDTSLISLTGIGIYQNPDDLGRDDALSFGGIASITPFGLTTRLGS